MQLIKQKFFYFGKKQENSITLFDRCNNFYKLSDEYKHKISSSKSIMYERNEFEYNIKKDQRKNNSMTFDVDVQSEKKYINLTVFYIIVMQNGT